MLRGRRNLFESDNVPAAAANKSVIILMQLYCDPSFTLSSSKFTSASENDAAAPIAVTSIFNKICNRLFNQGSEQWSINLADCPACALSLYSGVPDILVPCALVLIWIFIALLCVVQTAEIRFQDTESSVYGVWWSTCTTPVCPMSWHSETPSMIKIRIYKDPSYAYTRANISRKNLL